MTPTEVVAATLTAPTDGKVTVIADAHIFDMGGGDFSVTCAISTGSDIEAGHEVYGLDGAAVRVFDITGGHPVTYRLNCRYWPVPDVHPTATNAHLSAIFTPSDWPTPFRRSPTLRR